MTPAAVRLATITRATGVALVAFVTAFDLAERARVATNRNERRRLVRESNRVIAIARWLDSAPDNDDPEAWDAWRERYPFIAKTAPASGDRVSHLENELAELRAELARRDAAVGE